jgi:hypothetical protein
MFSGDSFAMRRVACSRKRVDSIDEWAANGPTVTTSLTCLLSPFNCSSSSFLIAFILYSYPLCKRSRSVPQQGFIRRNGYHGTVLDTRDYIHSFAFRQPLDTRATHGVVAHLALSVFRRPLQTRLDEIFLAFRRRLLSPFRLPQKPTGTNSQL